MGSYWRFFSLDVFSTDTDLIAQNATMTELCELMLLIFLNNKLKEMNVFFNFLSCFLFKTSPAMITVKNILEITFKFQNRKI